MRRPSGTVFIHPEVDEINELGNRHVADVRVLVTLRFAFDFEVAQALKSAQTTDPGNGVQAGFATI